MIETKLEAEIRRLKEENAKGIPDDELVQNYIEQAKSEEREILKPKLLKMIDDWADQYVQGDTKVMESDRKELKKKVLELLDKIGADAPEPKK